MNKSLCKYGMVVLFFLCILVAHNFYVKNTIHKAIEENNQKRIDEWKEILFPIYEGGDFNYDKNSNDLKSVLKPALMILDWDLAENLPKEDSTPNKTKVDSD